MVPSQFHSTDFKTYLQDLVTTQLPCTVQFRNETGDKQTIKTKITDLYSENGEDYLLLSNSIQISMKQLVDVDGFNFNSLC
jgi:hypothetical protein